MTPPSTVYASGHIFVVLRRSPARITSSSLSPHRRAEGTLPRPQLDQEYEGRHPAKHVLNADVPYVRYLIGRIVKTYDYINRVVINLPHNGLRGYVDTLSPLVSMHLLDRSCVVVGIFLKYCVPQQWYQSRVYA